ncbi:hypothetical protein NQ318_016153 [Aromia moschata]|uniref:Uncharacterized protein n=1 Tax=Aromia moschata TaxID=1265417 RepID=A0AAV8XZ01_9CUCU|nr:hypothetical protein NQ318_016153 [Aromia moschata]
MDQQEFLVSEDLNFHSFNEEITPESTIKAEEIKDEDDILLFAQLDNLTNNISNNEYQIVQEVEVVDQLQGTPNEFGDKLPIDLTKLSDTGSDMQNEGSTSHYVRYKLQDGKHVKIWECGIWEAKETVLPL